MSLMQQIAELGDKVSYLEKADREHSEREEDLGDEDSRLSQFISLIQGLSFLNNALFLTLDIWCLCSVASSKVNFFF